MPTAEARKKIPARKQKYPNFSGLRDNDLIFSNLNILVFTDINYIYLFL